MNTENNIKRFEELFSEIKRDGSDKLLEFIRKSDFYKAPASTRFHLNEEGGLLQHSLNVYDCLVAIAETSLWKPYIGNVSKETLAIVSLLHDLCKTYYYTIDYKNQKTYDAEKVAAASPREVKHDIKGDFIWEVAPFYTVDNKYPVGHGSKSVIFIQMYMKLTMQEIMAINWHMGAYCDNSQWGELGEAFEKYPLALALHQADAMASALLESKREN